MGHYDECREGYCGICGQTKGNCEHTGGIHFHTFNNVRKAKEVVEKIKKENKGMFSDEKRYYKVLEIISKYDPLELIEFGLHENEYEIESIEIANRSFILKINDLSQYIKEVFEFWFYKGCIDDKTCLDIAEEIKLQ